jgi:hypothetical protein
MGGDKYHLWERGSERPNPSGSEQHIGPPFNDPGDGDLIAPDAPSRAAPYGQRQLEDLFTRIEEVAVVGAADQELPQLRSDTP